MSMMHHLFPSFRSTVGRQTAARSSVLRSTPSLAKYMSSDSPSSLYGGHRDRAQRAFNDTTSGQSSLDRTRPKRTPFEFNPNAPVHVDRPVKHLLTLADLSTAEITRLLKTALAFKVLYKRWGSKPIPKKLLSQTVALLFSKRSTRTRVASESSTALLGGHAMFLGQDDIQLGVNESLEDTAKVVSSMVDGIMARVGPHSDIETLAKGSTVPVINALSDLWHPTQILADLLTMLEFTSPEACNNLMAELAPSGLHYKNALQTVRPIVNFKQLEGKKIVWVGDVNNVLYDMLVTYPRLGMTMAVASPKGYDQIPEEVWKRVQEGGEADKVQLTNSPQEALKDADIVVTDTWISMGWESEKEARLKAFEGYQVTEKLCAEAGAKPDWKFMHCLPRKQDEVDDDVFYGKRSVVFPEAENRKWTIMAIFHHYFGARDM